MDWAEETAVDALRKKANKYEYGRPFFSEQVRNVAQALRDARGDGVIAGLQTSKSEVVREVSQSAINTCQEQIRNYTNLFYPFVNFSYEGACRACMKAINKKFPGTTLPDTPE